MAVCSLVFGIISCLLPFVPILNIAIMAMAIVGIVMGATEMKRARERAESTGIATAGLITCIVGTALSALGSCVLSCYCVCAGCAVCAPLMGGF